MEGNGFGGDACSGSRPVPVVIQSVGISIQGDIDWP